MLLLLRVCHCIAVFFTLSDKLKTQIEEQRVSRGVQGEFTDHTWLLIYSATLITLASWSGVEFWYIGIMEHTQFIVMMPHWKNGPMFGTRVCSINLHCFVPFSSCSSKLVSWFGSRGWALIVCMCNQPRTLVWFRFQENCFSLVYDWLRQDTRLLVLLPIVWLTTVLVCLCTTSGLTEGSAQVGPDPREEGLRKEMEREKAKWGLVYAFLCVINQPILCCERACRSIILSSHSTWRWSLLLHMTIQVPILKYGLASFSGNFWALWIIYSHGESMGIILLWFCTH